MEKFEKIDFSQIEDYSNSETLVKKWVFTEEEEISVDRKTKETSTTISKVVLTNKRLIVSEQKNDETYRKHSFRLGDIKAVNYSITQQIPGLLLSIFLMVIGSIITAYGIVQAIMNFSPILILVWVVGLILIGVGIAIYLNRKILSKLCMTIELDKTHTHKFLESSSREKNNKIFIPAESITQELELQVTPEAIDMCTTLDNLIMEAIEL